MNNLITKLKLGLILLTMVFSIAASAQNVLVGAQSGTIQELGQDDGYIIISGRRFAFDREITEISLKGEEFDDADLSPGMVLRFTIRNNMLMQIQILGPSRIIEEIDVH